MTLSGADVDGKKQLTTQTTLTGEDVKEALPQLAQGPPLTTRPILLMDIIFTSRPPLVLLIKTLSLSVQCLERSVEPLPSEAQGKRSFLVCVPIAS